MSRVDVRKTHKLFIGGAFPRSESGRTYEVTDAKGEFIANVAQASGKDARDAVLVARAAFAKWSTATAYNRGQVLYRIAEIMEGRREQFIHEVAQGEGLSNRKASQQVDAAIDRWIWYAGWADKYTQAIGNTNPVAGPLFNFSIPEPTGVVAAVAPQDQCILGLVSVIAPIITTGNAVIVMPSPSTPIPAVTLAECLATSDVPGGVVNILTGAPAEVMPCLAEHADANALDLTGIVDDAVAADLERQAAGSVKRVRQPKPHANWDATPSLSRIRTFTEIKTIWHPQGT